MMVSGPTLSLGFKLLTRSTVADLYIILFSAIRANPDKVGHGRDGYYFGENGEHILYDVGKEVGRALVALGKTSSDEPTTFTQEDLDKYFKVCLSFHHITFNGQGLITIDTVIAGISFYGYKRKSEV